MWKLQVQLLVRAGCDTSIVNQGCRNAMHMATQSGHTDIVEILLRAGVDINMQDNDMNSPLLLAGKICTVDRFKGSRGLNDILAEFSSFF